MAKNIKKRSASHIYFGVNKLTGELKHISEVPSGQKCNCICAACLQPFEARKGTRRRHHFAHVSNYECMYASEVAIYKAFAEALKQSGFLALPPVMLRFPAWHDPELLQEARRMKIDSVAFECEPLSYPPLLRVTMQGTPLRILLDFDRYYDDDDRVELAEEAKAEDYSLLLISMPKIEQDTEFTPDRLQSVLQDNDRTEWVFSRLEEQWKQMVMVLWSMISSLEKSAAFLWRIFQLLMLSMRDSRLEPTMEKGSRSKRNPSFGSRSIQDRIHIPLAIISVTLSIGLLMRLPEVKIASCW